MSDDLNVQADRLIAALTREIENLGPCEFVFSPQSMLRCIGLLQLAARHPRLSKDHQRFIRTFVEHGRKYFAQCPAALSVIEAGDDPRRDMLS